jgi:hypothetical protein
VYSDTKPCRVCGSDVRLRPPQGYDVAEPDGPVDERVCTNERCETNRARGADAPKP